MHCALLEEGLYNLQVNVCLYQQFQESFQQRLPCHSGQWRGHNKDLILTKSPFIYPTFLKRTESSIHSGKLSGDQLAPQLGTHTFLLREKTHTGYHPSKATEHTKCAYEHLGLLNQRHIQLYGGIPYKAVLVCQQSQLKLTTKWHSFNVSVLSIELG